MFNGLPYLEQLKDERTARRARRSVSPSAPPCGSRWARAPSPRLASPCPRSARPKRLTATDLEVEKGYSLAAARAEAIALPAVRVPEQRRLRPAEPRRRVRHHRQRPRRQGQPRARGRAPVRAPVHPPRHGAAASPAAGACACAATWPARPATTSPAGASASTSTRPTARRSSWPTASAAAAASRPVPPARSPSTSASWPRSTSTRAAASCATSASTCARWTRSRRPTTSRTRATSGANSSPRAASSPAGTACAPAAAPRSSCARSSWAPEDPVVVSAATGCLEVSTTIYPYTSWKGSYIHTAFENAAATLSGVETAYRALKKKGLDRGEHQVHRLRRRRRHLRHRPAVALRRHGARPPDAVRLLRQRRLHEHRLPALRRDADGRLDHHQPGRQVDIGQAAEPQEPHRHHDRPRARLRGPGLAARPARPRAQVGQGPGHAGRDVHQRARALPPRLALRTARRPSTSPARPSRPATGRSSRSWTASTG